MKHYDEENDERKTVEPKKHIRSYKTFLKVCCIILCFLIGAVAVTTATSEAFRIKVFGFLFEEKEGYVDIVPSEKIDVLYPSYLPDGYKKLSEGDFGESVEISYQNEKTKDTITIFQEHGTDFQQSVDSETTNREQCLVGSYEAYYFSEATEGALHTLIWQREDMIVEIISTLEKEEMIKIGISLK